METSTYDILYECLTERGERPVNEDSLGIAVEKDRISFILCDGLGGHGKGDIASSFVVQQMRQMLEKGLPAEECVVQAQADLLQKQMKENAGDSMKTTLTCLTISGEEAKFIHVGDSRIYQFVKGKYCQRTQDHSVPQMLVNCGMIKEKEIRHHEDRSRLLRVMGTEWESPQYQVVDSIAVDTATSFLLCSDGFWELIDEKKMAKTLRRSKEPKQWLHKMKEIILANGRGTNMDNYSAIAIFLR